MAAPKGNHNHLKHGGRGTRLYYIWKTMRSRCNTPTCNKYKNYGARGISICKEWDDFSAFRDWAMSNGYSDALTIDRIDVNGNYEPDNCRWATIIEQENNKTTTRWLDDNGVKISMANFCRKYNLNYKRFASLITNGIEIGEAKARCS